MKTYDSASASMPYLKKILKVGGNMSECSFRLHMNGETIILPGNAEITVTRASNYTTEGDDQ